MKNFKLLHFISLAILTIGCNSSKNSEADQFSFDTTKIKSTYLNDDTVSWSVLNPENKKIDSIVYFINDKRTKSATTITPFSFSLKDQNLGYQNCKAVVYADGEKHEIFSRIELVSSVQPQLLTYTIVNKYPHDVASFTEGLEFYKDTLYESTGKEGTSYFRKYDYKTAKVFKEVTLDKQHFGEGITLFKDKIYQLTWKSNVGFVYNAKNLKLEKQFQYDKPIEGWGMTHDENYLYQSDGTEKIWKMNPTTLKMEGFVNVYVADSKVKSVNELEYINGSIYGNIWQKDAIAVIDPKTGAVTAILNLSDLRKQVKNPDAEVLNGIAYNPKTKTIFVTGKNWDTLFEIRVK